MIAGSINIKCQTDRDIQRGIDSYLNWCNAHDIRPHQSAVHDFDHAIRDAQVLAVAMSTPQQRETLAQAVLLSHLLDDLIDNQPVPDAMTQARGDQCELAAALPGHYRCVFDEMIRVVSTRLPGMGSCWAVATMLQYSLYGALIARAATVNKRKSLSIELRRIVARRLPRRALGMLSGLPVRASVAVAHVGVAPFLAIEGINDPQLAAILDLWYGPLVHASNQRKEQKQEVPACIDDECNGFADAIETWARTRLITIATQELVAYPDPNQPRRLHQMRMAVETYASLYADDDPLIQQYQGCLHDLEHG